MITRDIIRELASFQSSNGDAITFYYQPGTPQDKSHRQEAIHIKDLVKDATRRAERSGKNGLVRRDLDRILQLAEGLHGNSGKAKAIFACASQNYWREFDFPADLKSTQLLMNSHFHIRPLAELFPWTEKTCVCLVDRTKARFLEMQGDDIAEKESFEDEIPRRGRSDGFFGYDAGHAERKVDNEVMNHYKHVNDRLMERWSNGSCDNLVVGHREEGWTGIERVLHPYVRQRLVGHFVIDPVVATPDEVRQAAQKVLAEHRTHVREELLKEVLDQARANNLGALGLKRVLRSMEQGEIQSLLIGEGFASGGVRCSNCGHIDIRRVENCAVCGQKTHELDDIADALVGRALSAGMDVSYVPANPEFQKAGNIGALLRFRAERSVGERLAG